jgi:hypothetical protein
MKLKILSWLSVLTALVILLKALATVEENGQTKQQQLESIRTAAVAKQPPAIRHQPRNAAIINVTNRR